MGWPFPSQKVFSKKVLSYTCLLRPCLLVMNSFICFSIVTLLSFKLQIYLNMGSTRRSKHHSGPFNAKIKFKKNMNRSTKLGIAGATMGGKG